MNEVEKRLKKEIDYWNKEVDEYEWQAEIPKMIVEIVGQQSGAKDPEVDKVIQQYFIGSKS